MRFYELLNAQHLDTLNRFSGFATMFVRLHYYSIQTLDLLYDHLTRGTPLPPSQVVRSTPPPSKDQSFKGRRTLRR